MALREFFIQIHTKNFDDKNIKKVEKEEEMDDDLQPSEWKWKMWDR